ncbi:MAG TPA: hypothetical protein VF532_10080 [Candidatus Angelobacter sp.]
MLRWLTVFIILCQVCAAQARVRLVVDLKKTFGYERADKFGDERKRWKAAHGAIFLSNNALLVYQVHQTQHSKNGPPEAFYVQLNLIDAQDGHEVRKLRVPAVEPRAFAAATHDGGFLLATGNTLHAFSAQLEKKASKAFTLVGGKVPEDWEMSVTPSASAVVLVHHHVSRESKGGGASAGLSGLQGEVELLNADDLAPMKSLTVTRLHGWSAGEDFILTKDPRTAADSRGFGVLEWSGQWTPLHTAVEKTDCYFVMHAIQGDRVAAFDCDELAVVSRSGKAIFSFPAAGADLVTSIASQGDYLAAAFFSIDEFRDALDNEFGNKLRGEYITLFDLRNKVARFRVHAEELGISYSVSSDGALAVVDGTRLKIFERKE